MRKRFVIPLFAAAVLATVVFYAAPFQGSPRPLAGTFPSGPVLYLEAKNFGAELRAWSASEEQTRWLASTRYESFARSNLFLKLQSAWNEFTAAAGFLPDSELLQSIAGTQSALAIYDIGNLEFLYVTRIPNASLLQTTLWQSRVNYETRHAGGVDFFVRVDSGRTVAFASAGEFLILGTREELVAGALRLLAGEPLTAVAQEAWYTDTTSAAGTPGDLRLVMNLDSLVQMPQFRSYWIQRNASEIRNYRAAIADLVHAGGEFREDRVLLRKSATEPVAGNAESLLRLVPDDAAFSHAWAKPSAGQAVALIEQKLLSPKVTSPLSYDFAPPVQFGDGAAGAESDLETRIDEPPLAAQSSVALDDLRRLLAASTLDSILQVQSSTALPDGVLVETPSVVAIVGANPWDGAAARSALSTAAASLWTSASHGTAWTAHQRGPRTWFAMDGLARLQMAVDGNLLLLANSEAALVAVLDRIDRRPTVSDASSVALFRHATARDGYRRMMTQLDSAQPAGNSRFGFSPGPRPAFFSVDLWSLSDIFAAVREVEVRTRDTGATVRETVTYRLAR